MEFINNLEEKSKPCSIYNTLPKKDDKEEIKIFQKHSNSENKNNYDKIWEYIIKINNIDLSKDLSFITSKQIKNSKKDWKGKNNQFEPRLLCKMDQFNSRPQILKDNNISLLSIKNGEYILIRENIYKKLQKYLCAPKIIKKRHNSLLLDIGDSETSMLDKMLYNGIFEDIIGEKVNGGPFLGGRHRCNFETNIGEQLIEVKGSQYETDGCYETDNYVCIVEAKNIECEDFNIRQLYYPFREVHNKVGDKKKIINLFIYKDKQKIIHIHKFEWGDYKKMLDLNNTGYYQYIEGEN